MTASSGYYLAMTETHEHLSRQSFLGSFLVLAIDDVQAHAVVRKKLGTKGEHQGSRQGDGGYFFDVGEKGWTTYLMDLREVSPATMAQLVHVIPCYGDSALMPTDSFENNPRMLQF